MNTTNLNTHRIILDQLIIVVASIVLVGGGITARAQILFTDGDYDAQTIGSPVGAPWGPFAGSNTVTANAQSIYDNVYLSNGKGVNLPTTSADNYLVRDFPGTGIPASSTNLLYFNVDFRNNSDHGGDYTIVIAEGASGAKRSVAFEVTGTNLWAESSDEIGPIRENILTLETNIWYNLQVTLDMATETYSGTVVFQTGSTVITNLITSRPFVKPGFGVSTVYTDSSTGISTSGPWPDHDFDNWALSDSPLNPPIVPGTFVKSTSPSGSAVDKNAVVTVELQDNLTQVVTNSIQLFFNGLAVSPDSITKPANVTTITYDPPGSLPSESINTVRIVWTDTASVMKTNDFSFVVPGPYVSSTSPVGTGILPSKVVKIQLTDINTQVATNLIQLFFNELLVSPGSITKAASLTTVTYDPPDPPVGSTNTVRIVFSDTSSPPVVKTNEFSFVVSLITFLFTDGDFDAQTIGSPVGAPWAGGGGRTCTVAAQSPYTNVYQNNGKGASFPTSGIDAYIVRSFTAIPASSTDPLYFNVDFLNTDAPSGIGKYTMLISGDGYYTTRSVGFDVRSSTLRASTPAGDPLGEIFMTLAPDTWYNLQVTLDMAAKTYSGVVSSLAGGSTNIPSRPFVNTTYAIDKVYTDTSSYGGAWPSHYTDNWALSTTPMPPLFPLFRLSIARQGGNVVISWEESADTLQSANAVTGPWADVLGATSPHTVTPVGNKFYRLRR